MNRRQLKKWLKKEIKNILLRKDRYVNFRLDYLKICHPKVFDIAVCGVLNDMVRKREINLDGIAGQDLRKR